MINPKMKWYHWTMVPFAVQAAVTIAALIMIGVQMMIYDGIEEDIVVFEGTCDVTVGSVDEDGETRQGATMMCGEELRYLGALEAPYLYNMLTANASPAIVCVKTESEFLKEIAWTCDFESKEEEV